jgi:hypothetical protein
VKVAVSAKDEPGSHFVSCFRGITLKLPSGRSVVAIRHEGRTGSIRRIRITRE